jgi:lysophospholipase L1-like esterase
MHSCTAAGGDRFSALAPWTVAAIPEEEHMHHQLTRPMRRVLMSATALTCASLLAGTLASGAQAKKAAPIKRKTSPTTLITPSTPVARGAGYLALGDSVSFGYMEPTVVPAPDYTNAANFVGFPEVVASDLHLKLTNLACPGETSSSLINDKAPSYACETNPNPSSLAYRATFPLHVRYRGSQLSYAVRFLKKNPHVRLVTLMIGANDYFLCQETTADHCQSPIEQIGVVGTVTKNVRKIIATLRDRAHYNGQLVIVDYYSVSSALAAATAGLNHETNLAGHGFHIRVANAFNAFAHASAHSGGSACTAGLLTQLSTGGCGVHPSSAGQSLLASTVIRAVRLPR